ncbi:hypothetical protein ACFVYP_36765 [Kitasatospora sp. NPDC058201]|uniref:hypothetical protein n=1 Tax=unclassified Kitasatospora TaxID=2633591 RepID=UPI00364D3F9E
MALTDFILANDPTPKPGGKVDSLVTGLAPDWGPFASVGGTARTVIQAIMAAVILILLGRALIGMVHLKVGGSQHDTVQVKQGQKELAGSLIAAFIVASIGTLFTIVYGMGI